MNKIIFFTILFCGTVLLACKEKNRARYNTNNVQNLFAASDSDTTFFDGNKKNAQFILGIDSAYKNSELVVICTPLSIDSSIHQQKASFYLVGIKVDSVLKGAAHINSGIYFIDVKPPDLVLGTSGWVAYLSRRKNGRLLAYNNIVWQWTDNAPFSRGLPMSPQRIFSARKKWRPKKISKRTPILIFARQPIEHAK